MNEYFIWGMIISICMIVVGIWKLPLKKTETDPNWMVGEILCAVGILSLLILLSLGVFYLYFFQDENILTWLYTYLPLKIAFLIHIFFLGFSLWVIYHMFKRKPTKSD